MFYHTTFIKVGVKVEKRACADFYKAFVALAKDSCIREACEDDPRVALAALSLTTDLLTGAVTLSPE